MKKTALTLLKIVVSLGILVYIFTKVIDIRHLWANLREADISYVVAGILVYFLVQTLSAWRWYLLIKPQDLEVGFGKVLAFYFLGMYFNFFLPSAIGGDVFKVYYLHKETGRLSASTASVFFDRDIGMGGLLLVATVVSTVAGTRTNGETGLLLAPIFGLIGAAFIAANLALFYRPTYDLLHKLLTVFRLKEVDKKIQRLFDSVNAYRGRWGLIAVAMLMSVGVQVGCVFANMLAADAIGMHTRNGWIDYLVLIPTIGLIGMIPLSMNGTGWREASYIILFSLVIDSIGGNLNPTDPQKHTAAATLSLLWFAMLVVTSLPGGIVYVARGGRKTSGSPPDSGILEEDDLAPGKQEAGPVGALTGAACEEEPVPTR
ncbi:MAG: lysylphosphatidylglycerol synthase transmembrane domain-containing protein [Blastocatellia bacterium]